MTPRVRLHTLQPTLYHGFVSVLIAARPLNTKMCIKSSIDISKIELIKAQLNESVPPRPPARLGAVLQHSTSLVLGALNATYNYQDNKRDVADTLHLYILYNSQIELHDNTID